MDRQESWQYSSSGISDLGTDGFVSGEDPERGKICQPVLLPHGHRCSEWEKGTAVLRMGVRPDMHNGAGWLQGGILTALADEVIALALYPLLSPREGIATLSESTSFVRGVREGFLMAEGRVIKKGRRIAFSEGKVYADDPNKTLLSTTSAAFAITTVRSGA